MQWKQIKGFEGLYEISDTGEVKNTKRNKIVKPRITIWGYSQYGLMKKHKRYWRTAHRLVAQAFIPKPKNKREVNHIDGNKLNNNVKNLEWTTRRENIKHAIRMGLQQSSTCKRILCVETGEVFNSAAEAARKYKKARDTIARAANGTNITSAGYHWKYI